MATTLRRVLPLLMLLCPWALAQVAARPDAGFEPSASDGRAWLARIQAAAAAGNFQGTLVSTADGVMSSSRVGHYAVGEQTYEHVEALDGRLQRMARHNDAVYTLWPQAQAALVEKRETLAAWSTTPQEVDPQALDQYTYKSEGRARWAGRDVVVMLMEPRDTLRYAQRLWADTATGLMLRADVLGLPAAPGLPPPTLLSTGFSEIAIGVKPQPEHVLQVVRSLRKLEADGLRVLRPQQQRTSLQAEGWALARPVAGFRLSGCVLRRGMDAAPAEGAAAPPILQAVFSDGLTHVSLFIEPYNPQRQRSETQARRGATHTLLQRRGEHWYTVVGDVPAGTLQLFIDAVDRRKP